MFLANATHPMPDAEQIDLWFESMSEFEDMLEDMAKVSLDPVFKDELNAIDQWFTVLSDAERTAALYSLLQHASDLQVRFFITILQQMAKMDPAYNARIAAQRERHS
ncbi:Flap-structured DNA-binding and RNA-binding protein, partial [Spiromyces aspiralis]